MKRTWTNAIRFLMDECLPPLIRDNRVFMWPFYVVAYRGKNIRTLMNFKRLAYGFGPPQYAAFYAGLDSISRHRETDLNEASLRYILARLHPDARNLLDVGCGKGYFLDRLRGKGLALHGCDVVDEARDKHFGFVRAFAESLPFPDRSFDVVTCFHTLEHILRPEKAVAELKRVARRQVIVVVPRQRDYFYTLDEHVNFFPFRERLTALLDIPSHTCEKIWGDWVYVGRLDA